MYRAISRVPEVVLRSIGWRRWSRVLLAIPIALVCGNATAVTYTGFLSTPATNGLIAGDSYQSASGNPLFKILAPDTIPTDDPRSVPEPATAILAVLGAGVLGMIAAQQRRRRTRSPSGVTLNSTT